VNSMAKAIDETISRHNLVPPQVESVSSFAKGSEDKKKALRACLKSFQQENNKRQDNHAKAGM